MIASGGATAAELPTLYSNLGAITFNAGDYAKAAAAFKKLIELQPDNADAKSNLAAALAQQGNPAEAAALVQQRIAAAEAAGQAVPEGLYKQADRQRVGLGKRVSERVDIGGSGTIKKKKSNKYDSNRK